MGRLMALILMLALLLPAQGAAAAPYAHDVFGQLWQRYDLPVYQAANTRSWTWGFQGRGVSAEMNELFYDAPGGVRAVYYLDKGRMEITEPEGDSSSPWYVTSGLLPIELLSGRMQLGYTRFEQRPPATIAAMGDPGSFPAYADLWPLYQSPGNVSAGSIGKPASCLLNANGTVGTTGDHAGDQKTRLVRAENGHSIAQAFLDFQTQVGPVYEGSNNYPWKQVYDPPLFTFGLPVSEPCWVTTTIGGRAQPVLFQVFERRVLTYNPANEPIFQVEMGNIGQHYYIWRYGRTSDPRGPFGPTPVDWQLRRYQVPSNPQVVYTLDVETKSTSVSGTEVDYTLYVSHDGGATRERRSNRHFGPCHYAAATLAPPADVEAAPERIGIAWQCADYPSESRGAGVAVWQSHDEGRSFWPQRGY